MNGEHHIKVGDKIADKFIVEAILGEGGMGVVVRAIHEVTHYRVAVKLLHPDAAANAMLVTRFKREASAANRIGHAGFVKPFDFGVHEGRPFLVMEYLEGCSLSEEVKRNGPMPVPRAAAIVVQIADAVQAAHDAGIIHRDLKPANVIVLPGDVVKVLDLGIAKFLAEAEGEKTKSTLLMGSIRTMSPEQCRGAAFVDNRSDIYSLAVVTFFLCTGQYPFVGEEMEVIAAQMRDLPPRLTEVRAYIPRGFSDLVFRDMAKDPAARHQSMAEVASDLKPFCSGARMERTVELPTEPEGVVAAPSPAGVSSGARVAPPRRRSRAPTFAALGVFAVAALGGIAYSVHRRSASRPPPAQAAAPPPAPAAPKRSHVVIAVTPSDAQVLVDGVARSGPAPYDLEVEQGRQLRIEARRDGYEPVNQPVLATSEPQRVEIALKPAAAPLPAPEAAAQPPAATAPAMGKLEIFVEPWAEVFVDGKRMGQTPKTVSLAPGTHRVRLVNEKAGHPAVDKRVNVRPGKKEVIDLDWTK